MNDALLELNGVVSDAGLMVWVVLVFWFVRAWVSAGVVVSPRRLVRLGLRTLCVALPVAVLWQALVYGFSVPYDAPGSWCWTCVPLLDAAGELTENALALAAGGVTVGLVVGTLQRLVRR